MKKINKILLFILFIITISFVVNNGDVFINNNIFRFGIDSTAYFPHLNVERTLVVNGKTVTGYRLVNRYYVGGQGNFQTINDAVSWLETNMTAPTELLLDGGGFPISDSVSINLPYQLHIRSLDFQTTTLYATTGLTGKSMINIHSNVSIERVTFDGTTLAGYGTLENENAINIENKHLYCEVTNFAIYGFSKGINLTGGSEIFVFNGIIDNCHRGVEVNSNDSTTIDIEIINFDNCSVGVNLAKSAPAVFDIQSVFFNNSVNDTSVNYVGGTYVLDGLNPMITGCKWNGNGDFLIGFDFSRVDGRDANIFIQTNVGLEDKSPHLKVNVLNSTDTVRFPTGGVWKKAKYTIASSYTCKYTIGTNRYTYQPDNKRDVWIIISGNVSSTATNSTGDIAVIKNGITATKYAQMTFRTATASQPYPFPTLLIYLTSLGAGDYFEIWYSTVGSNESLTFNDLHIMSFAQ